MLDYLRKLFHRVITSIHGHGNISSNSISTNDKVKTYLDGRHEISIIKQKYSRLIERLGE